MTEAAHSRNKRSVALDLKDPAAQDSVRELANDADVLIENFRPGAMEGFNLAPEALIGYCSQAFAHARCAPAQRAHAGARCRGGVE